MIASVVVMSGIAEKKCSNCCELSIGFKATFGRWCEWSNGKNSVAVISTVAEEKLSNCD